MHMRQAVAYKRLKMMENYKTVRPKSGHNHLREVVSHGVDCITRKKTPLSLSPPLEKHIGCSICFIYARGESVVFARIAKLI